MPIKDNARKALRQAKKRTLRNQEMKDKLRGAMKATKKAIAAGTDTKELIRAAQQTLDKAAKQGVIKKGTASRKLSRLMKQMQKAGAKK